VLAVLVLASLPAPATRAAVSFADTTAQAFPAGLVASHYNWGDCDGDGDDDLLVGANAVYINDGPPNWTFTRKADTGALGSGPHGGAQWFDLDNDGDLDVAGVGWDNNERLYRNDGDCSFTDVSDMNGDGTPTDLGDGGNSVTVAPGDYDADGFLDFFVGVYERHCGGTPTVCADCMPDRLWRNLGTLRFQNVYESLGMEAHERGKAGYCVVAGTPCTSDAQCAAYPADACKSGLCARSSNWVDYNNDGWLDLYVGEYRLDPNQLWENGGNGTFQEVGSTAQRNADGEESGGAWGHTLGTDWADFDNDGDMDVFVADLAHGIYYYAYGHDISLLYANGGPSAAEPYSFTDWRPQSGMKPYDPFAQPDWCETAPAWGDYDNDGDLDIYVSHIYETSVRNSSTLYSNDGDRTFTDTTTAHGFDFGLYHDYSTAWCDYDQDGDLDLATYGATAPTGQPSRSYLLRNDGGNTKPWIAVRLLGRGAGGTNAEAIGARVTVTEGSVSRIREVSGNHGYQFSRGSSTQLIGLGAVDGNVDSLTVRWTTRQSETFTDVPANARYSVHEALSVHRGTSPAAPLPRLAGGLAPYPDPVLADGQTYFYSISGGDRTLLVTKDTAQGTIVLSY
jgi:hypothetical protein